MPYKISGEVIGSDLLLTMKIKYYKKINKAQNSGKIVKIFQNKNIDTFADTCILSRKVIITHTRISDEIWHSNGCENV